MNKLTNIKHYKKEHVRALYGRFGKTTGLKPGVMWPRKEELIYLKQYEENFCPKLDDLIAENQAKKEEAKRKREQREREVLENLEKLPAAFQSFFEKLEARDKEQEERTRQREAMIEEVREILGFRAKPTDERFLKALAEREEAEAKAAKKEAKKRREVASLDEMLVSKP